MRLVATAVATVKDPIRVIESVCEHFSDHDAEVRREEAAYVVTFPFGTGYLAPKANMISLRAEADEMLGLYYMRMALAGHVKELAGESEPDIVWSGDGSDIMTPPNFRLIRVRAIRDITPHMRRIAFAGSDLARFASDEDLHMGLVIPQLGTTMVVPTIGKDGLLCWPEGMARPVIRRYTTRRCDPQSGTMEVDFVLHDAAGPGAAFAANCKLGDVLGVAGPFGSSVPQDRGWYLLAGDETALPAISRILEFLPEAARGVALIEVADEACEVQLASRTSIEVRWLHRNGEAPGTTTLLADAVRGVEFPADTSSVYAWVGCEFDAFKAIRAHLRKERGLKKGQQLVVAYWRKGASDEEVAETPQRDD
nr:siderophore-interacting protein [Rhodomicrobium vannielii]